MNAGTHANPVHAGDTLYSLTQVLDRQELSDDAGALRLRLLVVRNERPDSGFEPVATDPSSGKGRYHPHVVLDLDYWEIVARRPHG